MSVDDYSNGGWLLFYLLGVDATLDDRWGIWKHLRSYKEVKYLQGYLKILWIEIWNI